MIEVKSWFFVYMPRINLCVGNTNKVILKYIYNVYGKLTAIKQNSQEVLLFLNPLSSHCELLMTISLKVQRINFILKIILLRSFIDFQVKHHGKSPSFFQLPLVMKLLAFNLMHLFCNCFIIRKLHIILILFYCIIHT